MAQRYESFRKQKKKNTIFLTNIVFFLTDKYILYDNYRRLRLSEQSEVTIELAFVVQLIVDFDDVPVVA